MANLKLSESGLLHELELVRSQVGQLLQVIPVE